MKRRHSSRGFVSLLCCLAMVMGWLPVLPAAAASGSDVIFAEDFEGQRANAAFDYGTAYKASNNANGGMVESKVIAAGGGKYLRMTAQNAGSAEGTVARNRFYTVNKYGGSYTLEYDYCRLSNDGGHFDVYLRWGGYLRVRATATGGAQIYVHGNAAVPGVMSDTNISGVTLAKDTWYTFKAEVSDTQVTVGVYDKAAGKLLGQQTIKQTTEKDPKFLQDAEIWFDLCGHPTKTNTAVVSVGLDNVRMTEGSHSGSGTAGSASGDVSGSPVISADGNYGDKKWVYFTEDFESFNVGADTFYEADKTNYVFYASYHGEPSGAADASYSTYGIKSEGGSKVLDLTSYNTMRNYFLVNSGVSGVYTTELDFQLKDPGEGARSASTLLLNPFQGYSFSAGTIMVYIDGKSGLRITDETGGSAAHTYASANGSRFATGYGNWYTVRLTAEPGKLTAKVWQRGGDESSAGVAVVTNAQITEAINSGNGNSLRVQNLNRNQPGYTYGVKLDNLKLYKPYKDINVQSVAFGVPGSKLVLAPAFTGQELTAQRPIPQYKYTLGDTGMGSVNDKGELILGPKQGQTKLTMEMLDLRGKGTGVVLSTDLIVGTSNGVTPNTDSIKISESEIGSSRKISLTFSDAVKAKYPTPVVKWTSTNESVAKVSADGTISFVGFGKATVTGMVQDNGKDTMYYANIDVQVGQTPLRVLSIGNSYGRDSLYYLSDLAGLYGKRIEACYLEKGSGTLRQHARNVVFDRAEYSYWKSNPMTGVMTWQGTTTIGHAMEDGQWDIILLQQGPEEAGLPTTFNTDLDFMLDYVDDVQPDARIYWNMTWAYQQNISGSRTTNFKNYFNNSQAIMHNAIVDCVDKFIVGKDSKFGARFDGWLPVGAAVQNLRATMGDTITRDGFHMSLQAGRLVAAMTVLKTLYPEVDLNKITPDAVKPFLVTNKTDINSVVATDPDYANTEANMAKIRAAVADACKDLTRAPKKIVAPAEPKVENDTKQGDITIARVPAPLKLHFPDVTVLRDGTVLVSAYEHMFHVPNETLGEYFGKEGSGRLVIWKSTDNGRTYQELLSVDEPLLEKWGIATTSNRYERWKNGDTDYTFIADARDPNFGLVYFDITGDGKEDEVILYTFDMVDYHENRRGHTLAMTWSIDGGKTWAKPQVINGKTSSTIIKRGDIATFSNGQINVPTYLSNKIYLLLMDWSPAQQKWVLTHETIMPDFAPEETGNDEFNEMSLIAPDPAGNVVYGYIRANGTVVKSNDRGRTWELIGNEPGLIHQPGFAYIDENRMFVTWARVQSPRTVYGKVFYYNGDWTDTATRTIYASPVTSGHDMADPSCKLMANGEIITVSYDVAYRSIVATFDDPNSSEFALLEMNREAKQAVVYENKAPGTNTVTVSESLPSGYTACANATFAAGGKLTVKLGSGATVTFAEGQNGIVAGKTYHVAALTNGSSVYSQVWADGAVQGDKWTGVKAAQGVADGKIVYTGTNVTLNRVKVTTRVAITMAETVRGIAGGPTQDLAPLVQPAQSRMVWTSSDPKVVTVKDGVLTFVGQGKATVTLNAGGAVATCEVIVDPVPAEITGAGEKKVIFSDNFEDYTPGTNAFWNVHESKGYKSNGSGPNENRSYNILSENGNKVLQLTSKNGKATWHKVNTPIVGNYTVQYDFLFTGARIGFDSGAPGHYLYMNLWQDSGIHGFAVLCPEGIRVEYIPEGSTAVHYEPEEFGVSPIYDLNKWHTIKVVRVDGGIYIKVWERGTAEPQEWDMLSLHKEFDASASSFFRMQYYAGGTDELRTMSIDNLTVTQQQGKGAEFMNDVSIGDWFYDAVDYAIQNGIMSGYNATTFGPNDTLSRAMVVQVLYNKEGQPGLNGAKHSFPDVPADQWFNNAVTWGSQKGVVSGFGDGKFRPNDAVTIEQVAVILHNYSGKPASTVEPTGVGKYDDWARTALGWAVEKGVMKDVPFTNATENATRAHTAQMLKNFIEKVANG